MSVKMFTAASVVTAALLCVPTSARADWLLTPFAGVTFGGAAENEHLSYGGSIGYMGAGIIGFEVDFGYTPEFFAVDDDELDLVSDSNVTSLMANLLIGVPIGGDNASVRPYVSGGAGLLRTSVTDADDLFNVSSNDFGVNVAAGVMVFFNDRVGVRGDVRYFRSLVDPEEDNEFDIDFSGFNFWRGTVGVTFKF